ncbi:tigger transposable element-derived protein 1-like [Anopheles moucheti]|uniref:tigger transposable element-derived protein 1-like n=1 Tax=Anopheles moucheti TaxID=186751 RepID=UPI0022F084DF|nr:tigger transposable element-derived protein 1-like [Anopheles moucheti]
MRPKKRSMLIELKREIIEKYEQGARVTDLARMYGRSTSTICAVLKRKELIKNMAPAKGVKIMSRLHSALHSEMEKLLMAWMAREQQKGENLTQPTICDKAREIYGDLLKQNLHPNEEPEDIFKASRGWFVNFRKRFGIHPVVSDSEAPKSDVKSTFRWHTYNAPLSEMIETKEDNPHKVWLDITTSSLASAWNNLWLEADAETAFVALEPEVLVTEEPEKSMDLEVDESRVKVELVEDQFQDPTGQIDELHSKRHVVIDRKISQKEESDTGEDFASTEIKEILGM